MARHTESNQNPIGFLVGRVTVTDDEGNWKGYADPWAWFSVFLLICAYFLFVSGYNGFQGRNCGISWDTDPPFGAFRKVGCAARSVLENLPDKSPSGSRQQNDVVTPPTEAP